MTKKKTKIVWLRFEVADTTKAQAEFQRAADRLFDTRSVESRGQFSEEEVVGMVKEALLSAQATEAAGGACTADGSHTQSGEQGLIAEQIMTGELSRLIQEALHDEVARICRGIADAEDVLP